MSVRTRNFQSVVNEVAVRMGVEPARMQRNQAAAYAAYVTAAYRLCLGFFDWPEAMRTEEMEVTAGVAEWSGGPGRGVIDMVRTVWREDPTGAECPAEACWRLAPQGIQMLGEDRALERVWVFYRPEAPVFTSEEWSAGLAYQYGGVRPVAYNPADGECHRCLSVTPVTGVALTDGAVWEKVPLLKVLAHATVLHAFGSALEEEDQFGKGAAKKAEANGVLEQEAFILTQQSGRRRNYVTEGQH